MTSSKNLEFKKNSFLSKSNNAFIEQMYLKFINKDSDLPESWQVYFEGIGDDVITITKEINGPSWNLKKNFEIDKTQNEIEKDEKELHKEDSNRIIKSKDLIKSNLNSIRAVALIRAYRQRGHLLAKLDPLGMMKTEYLDELHPEYYGFKKKNKKKKFI